jgi:uncharacterized protein YjbJ (UPF0337 family)
VNIKITLNSGLLHQWALFKGNIMNKHQVEGRVDEAKGKAKEVAGRVVGNESLEAEGMADQVKGKAQSGYGDAKEGAKDAAKKAIDKL